MSMTLAKLKKLQHQGEKIACVTAYEASQAHWVAEAGVEMILVGDSLGMVVQGHDSTLPVSLDDMVYHTQMVQRKNHQAWCIADLPFMADATLESTLHASARLMKEGQANMVKLEGGQRVLEKVRALTDMGIPVCGHLGLLPQSVQKTGYRVMGRDVHAAEQLKADALALEHAGADMLVLECVPAELAKEITESVDMIVIGIGSGGGTDSQVLVLHDMLGLTVGHAPKFSKNFLAETNSIQTALANYVAEVKSGQFPADQHILA